MPANIYIYCPSGDTGPARYELEEAVEEFLGEAGEECGGGAGMGMFNVDFELAPDEDPDPWADRLKPFLANLGVTHGTVFEVFIDGWKPGMPWRRVEVYGTDRMLTKRDPR